MAHSIKFLNEGFSKYLERFDINSNTSILESIKSVLSRLNEKGMSDEDRKDSNMLRTIYKKIDGKKLNPKNLSDEEQQVLSKYGIDAWGYKGDTKMVTPKRNDVVQYSDQPNRYNSKFDKINFADRARKVDSREYARNINGRNGYFGNKSFDELEREADAQNMHKNVGSMRYALNDRNVARDKLNNLDDTFSQHAASYKKQHDDAIKKADDDLNATILYNNKNIDYNNRNISNLLDKHKLKRTIESLIEAEISDEDRHDNELLKSIYYKTQNRSNAKLTPEEQNILNKYDLYRTDTKNIVTKNHKPVISNSDFDYNYRNGRRVRADLDKINFADRARKIDDRDYAQRINAKSFSSFQQNERDAEADEISKDAREMRRYLNRRRDSYDSIERAKLRHDKAVSDAKSNYDQHINQLAIDKESSRKYYNDRLKSSQDTIDKLLKKNEDLNTNNNLLIIETNLQGNINNEILRSVIGQMSDGMWENSPGMEKYWHPVDIDENNNIVISKNNRYYYDAYVRMSDSEIKKFFANKIKAIARQYLHDNNINPYTNWNENCEEECTYLSYRENVTIADAYKAYKQLLK